MGKSNSDLKADFLGTSKTAKLAKKYGVGGVHFAHPDGRSGKPTRMPQDVERAVVAKMNQDYDVRRSLEAASMAGNKKAQNIGAIDNIESALAAEKFMKKTHKNRMDLGGKYSSISDTTGVTDYWVNKDRSKLVDSMSANEQQDQAEKGVSEPTPPSVEMQNARDTVDELGNKDYDVFSTNIDNGDNQNQRDQAAQAFLGKYKLDLKEKKGIKPVLPC